MTMMMKMQKTRNDEDDVMMVIGCLRNDDGYGNDNAKKQ